MSFQPDAEPNCQAYLAARNKLGAELAGEYDNALVEYLCQQATATGTINSAMVSAALTNAVATVNKKWPTF